MGMTAGRFLPHKRGRQYTFISIFLFALVFGLPSWIGDENPLIIFPFFIAMFLLCFTGPWYARLIVGLIFYTLLLPLNMIVDSLWLYTLRPNDLLNLCVKLALWGTICLLVRRFVPGEIRIIQSKKLWALLGGLTLAPLFATLSFTLWNVRGFESDAYYTIALRLGYTVLPFVFLSALALLSGLMVLSRHETLSERQKLAEMQAVYYQGLQEEQAGIRILRHDLHNHITAAQSLLERGDFDGAKRYLDGLSHAPVLTGSRRFCENEIANAVLSGKAAVMEREGIQTDWEISLPESLSIPDIDICSLFGNALDNAIEAVREARDKRITVKVRADKGVLMMRVENTIGRKPQQEHGIFKTTKADPNAHGFGLSAIREIARRHGGSVETVAENGRFELFVYLLLNENHGEIEFKKRQ